MGNNICLFCIWLIIPRVDKEVHFVVNYYVTVRELGISGLDFCGSNIFTFSEAKWIMIFSWPLKTQGDKEMIQSLKMPNRRADGSALKVQPCGISRLERVQFSPGERMNSGCLPTIIFVVMIASFGTGSAVVKMLNLFWRSASYGRAVTVTFVVDLIALFKKINFVNS